MTEKKRPPLLDSMTLAEAAQALTESTGMAWTERDVLGRAVHHEITINARIGHAVRLVRSDPIEGTENELHGPAGCLPPLSAQAVRALLNAGEAAFDGWEHQKTIEFFGAPAQAWAMEWELAPGEVAPVVRFDDCRVSATGVLQLAAQYRDAELTAGPKPKQGQQKKLTAAQEAEVRRRLLAGEPQTRLAKEMDVSRPTIAKCAPAKPPAKAPTIDTAWSAKKTHRIKK